MPYCPHCGAEVQKAHKFCPACGDAIASASPVTTGAQLAAEGVYHATLAAKPPKRKRKLRNIIHSIASLKPSLKAVDLSPDGNTKGWVIFEVSADATDLTLLWEPSLFSATVEIPLR